ncbi:MAG: RHS repeat-associated core domain-containing protein, partial [Endozoicomonadaceae bacterium]|nr:RHS repeat-associated core domain-containing protein [Endozoicomonadaceae bacterium]
GQRTDPATGWQFLGSGHRTYNPQQRYFVSEDPAGGGYAFASNNPIMKTDPSGNMAKWLKQTFRILGYVGSLGFSAINGGNNTVMKWMGSFTMLLVNVLTIPAALLLTEAKTAAVLSVLIIPAIFGLDFIADIADDNTLNMVVAVVGALQAVVVVASAIFMPIGIFNFCVTGEEISGGIASEAYAIRRMSMVAENIAEREPPPKYGSINFTDENQSLARLRGQRSGPVGTANASGMAASQELPPQYEMSHISRGIDIATHAANLRDTPVDDSLLNGFMNTSAGVDTDMYRNAFRGLMASLDIRSTRVRNGVVNLDMDTLFPVREDSSTIVVGKDDIALIKSDSSGFTAETVNNSTALTTTSPLSYSDVMTPFYNEDGELVIYEYYRIR